MVLKIQEKQCFHTEVQILRVMRKYSFTLEALGFLISTL